MSDTRPRRPGSHRVGLRAAAAGLSLVVVFSSTSCGSRSGARGDTIDSEVFIATYVDLRTTALQSTSHRLSDEDRVAVLARHSVTAEDLALFAEVHGRDADFMREVWNDVESRMESESPSTEIR